MRTTIRRFAAALAVVTVGAMAVVPASSAQTSEDDLPRFCARLAKVQGKLAAAGTEQDTPGEIFARMRKAADAFTDAVDGAPDAIRDEVETLAKVFTTLADGLSPLQVKVKRAERGDDPEVLTAIGDRIVAVLAELEPDQEEIAAAADAVEAWAEEHCGISLAGEADESAAVERAAATAVAGDSAADPDVTAAVASAAPAQVPPPTEGFASDGDLIAGWYWLRDAAHADTGRWVLSSIPPGTADVTLDLTVLATSGVNGPPGVDARFFLSYGQGTSGAAEATVLVTLPNVSPPSDPVGYTTSGTFVIPRNAVPAGNGPMWVQIARRDDSGATVSEHIAVRADSVQVRGGGGETTTTTTTTRPPVTTTTVPPTTTTTRPLTGATAIVSMGDSFISGEAGRWNGNSINFAGCRDGTDRACRWEWVDVAREVQETIFSKIPFLGWITETVTRWVIVPVYTPTYDESRVYGTTGTSPGGGDGCHRSDVAEVNAPGIPVQKKINIACSGATTDDLLSAASGGSQFKGEQQQVDQLRAIADQTSGSTQKNQVRMIVVSIGGNDLRFSDIVKYCGWKYLSHPDVGDQPDLFLCADDTSTAYSPFGAGPGPAALLSQQNLDLVAQKVENVVDDIRSAMTDAGYSPSQYRIVLQSYPSPIPRGSDMGFPASGGARTLYGCPFWDPDATWARDTLVPALADRLEEVATTKNVAFLDLRDLFEGREICSSHATTPTPLTGPDASRSEWARVIMTGLVQGEQQESIHPNAYGQQALQRCLEYVYSYVWDQDQPEAHLACRNTLGQGIDGVYVQPKTP